MMRRRWVGALGLLMLVSFGGIVGATMKGRVEAAAYTVRVGIEVFGQVLQLVKDRYVEEIEPEKLIDGAIDGMLERLDPHSMRLKPDKSDEMTERLRGDYEGIGIGFEITPEGYLTVIAPIEGGPSDQLGIRAGDRIVKIEEKSAIGITVQEVYTRLRGPKGTTVHVSIQREGLDHLLEFDIVRDKIPIRSVPYAFMITPRMGYIRITRFAETTGEELEAALDTLEAQGMRKLLVDLRSNSGGLLPAAVATAEKFLEKGQRIVYTRGRGAGTDEDYAANPSPGQRHPLLPLIVMINHGSASASEIVSGAIQDWDRGLIVGQTSFGKGLVQGPFPLKDGSRLLLTISKYHTPSGRLIQRPYKGESREEYIRQGYEDVDLEAQTDSTGTNRPTYATLVMGRTVYGGGGITPDVILEPDLLSPFEMQLRQERAFARYADRYVGGHDSFGRDFESFLSQYSVSVEMLEEFRDFTEERLVQALEDSLEAHRLSVRQELEKAVVEILAAEQGVQRKNRGPGSPPVRLGWPVEQNELMRAYADQYVQRHGETMDDAKVTLPDKAVEGFAGFLKAQIAVALQDSIQAHSEFVRRSIKQEIAGRLWGDRERYQVAIRGDTEVAEAMRLFDDAARLLAQQEQMLSGGRP